MVSGNIGKKIFEVFDPSLPIVTYFRIRCIFRNVFIFYHRCGLCNDTFTTNKECKFHRKCIHEGFIKKPRNPYVKGNPQPEFNGVCDQCGFSYKTKASYNAHMRRNHNQTGAEVTCSFCGKKFSGEAVLNDHHKAVHKEMQCVECGMILAGSSRMYHHKKSVHVKEKAYKCETCGKGFVHRNKLEEHYNVHTGAKPFKCKYCPKAFGSQGTHAGHEKSHLGIKRKQKI